MIVIGAIGLFVFALALVVTVGMVDGPVARVRVERFARRQCLTITPSNGNQVIAYLATTRRWRVAGLLAGVYASTVFALAGGGLHLNTLTLFAGWFVGALLAETRVTRLPPGPRPSASLQPRRPTEYVSRFAWNLLPATVAVSAIAAIGSLLVHLRTGHVGPAAVIWFVAAVVIAVAVRIAQIQVLRRSQPLAETDQLAADDAVRSRSLHVLAGGGAALVLYCTSGQLAALNLSGPELSVQIVELITGLSVVVIPALGWNVATLAWRVKRPASAPGVA